MISNKICNNFFTKNLVFKNIIHVEEADYYVLKTQGYS